MKMKHLHINPVHLGLEHSQWVTVGRSEDVVSDPSLYVEPDDGACLSLTPEQHPPVRVIQGQTGDVGCGQIQQGFPICSV